jgi:hypothetical protein
MRFNYWPQGACGCPVEASEIECGEAVMRLAARSFWFYGKRLASHSYYGSNVHVESLLRRIDMGANLGQEVVQAICFASQR